MTEVARGAGAERDGSRRHLLRPAQTVGLLMRNGVNLIVVVVGLADPGSQARPPGRWLLAVLGCWSLYRVVTRSRAGLLLAVDYVFVLAVCVSLPVLVADPGFYSSNTAVQAIAGTAVISFAVAVPFWWSLLMTAGIAAGYAWGSAHILGWGHITNVPALYYFAVQWITAALLRLMLLRIAATVDQARAARVAAEVEQRVRDAVADYDREQLALLHDTAASTLLMVGQGETLPPHRLAAQARRDLELLSENPWTPTGEQLELVGALRGCATHTATPVRFEGLEQLWLNGHAAKPVIAAAREAMTNADRHAQATVLTVTVTGEAVILVDDGIGFDLQRPRTTHGVSDSILGRMRRAGGKAVITSTPGQGTTTELRWPATEPEPGDTTAADPERFIERLRARYGLALTAYAVANLAFQVPQSFTGTAHGALNAVLGVVAAVCALAAGQGIGHHRSRPVWPAGAGLAAVAVIQPMLLDPDTVGGPLHWAQNAIGWCALPLLLGLPTATAAAILAGYWILGAAVQYLCHPASATLVNIGMGTASILAVQLFALAFNAVMRAAAATAHTEAHAHRRLTLRASVERALHEEYQRRYAQLVDNVIPLLRVLSRGSGVDEQLQARAGAQSRRLRTLFDQASTFEHPLMRALRPVIDSAEARQVDVSVDLAGDLPDLGSTDDVDPLLGPIAAVMGQTTGSARIVVTASAGEISLSVVCRGIWSLPTIPDDPRVHLDITGGDDSVWVVVNPTPQEVPDDAPTG